MAVKEDIYLYLENKGITPSRAERDLGWSIGAIIKAKSITSDRLKEFLLVYTDLSAEWLLRGKGEMILREDGSPAPVSAADHDELVALRAENRVLRELLNLRSSEKKMETA